MCWFVRNKKSIQFFFQSNLSISCHFDYLSIRNDSLESEIHCQLEEPDDQLLDRKADNTVTSNSVSTDPQQLVLEANPARVKFTASQGLNTQLILDDFVLKKKKGPSRRKVSFSLEIGQLPLMLICTYLFHASNS